MTWGTLVMHTSKGPLNFPQTKKHHPERTKPRQLLITPDLYKGTLGREEKLILLSLVRMNKSTQKGTDCELKNLLIDQNSL